MTDWEMVIADDEAPCFGGPLNGRYLIPTRPMIVGNFPGRYFISSSVRRKGDAFTVDYSYCYDPNWKPKL